MYLRRAVLRLLATAVLLPVLASCAGPSGGAFDVPRRAYVARSNGGILSEQEDPFARYAPVFVIQRHGEPHNRIGTVAATRDGKGRERVYVDPAEPTLYAERQEFSTERGDYVNLIYRVHFQGVPGLRLTRGANVGLFVIVTLNDREEPVLVTTVHTCGCYVATVPTTYLPADARPDEWEASSLDVHGEVLPGLLRYPGAFAANYRPVAFVRDDTHRVMDIRVQDVGEAAWRYQVVPAVLRPMGALRALPVDGDTTSFFYDQGRRRGYVRGARKPLEMLLMGWWALDLYVGRDKDLGDRRQTGATFYTSLKPWRREESDMWPFADFLKYWGWRL